MADFVIPSVFKAVDKFSATVAKIEKSTKTFADRAESNLARVERKWRAIGSAAQTIGRNSAIVGAAIIAPMILMANESVKFEKSISNIATIIDTQSESMEQMGDRVLELSQKLPVPIDELTASLYDIRSAGISAADQFEVLEYSAKLAISGLSSTQEATDITTSALNAFASQGLGAAKTTDILFKAVQYGKTTIGELSMAFGATAPIIASANLSLEDFMAATSALTTLGTPAAQAQNQIKAAIVALQKPTADMDKAFKKLGVTSEKELFEKFGGMVGGFEAVNGAIQDLGLNTAKTWGSTEALAAVMSSTGATNKAYLTTLDAMTNGTMALGDAFDKQSATSSSQMQLAKNNIKAVSITIGNVLLPIINDLLKSILPMIKNFGQWAKNNKALLTTIVKVAVTVAGLAFAVSGVSYAVAGFTKLIQLAKFGLVAFNIVTKAASIAWKLLNSAFAISPIGLIIGGVIALGGAIYALTRRTKEQTATEKLAADVQQRAMENTIDQRVEVSLLFAKLRHLEAGTSEYMAVLKQVEAIQPGITAQFNLEAGAVRDLAAAENQLMKNIIARAQAQAKSDILAEKTRELLELQMQGSEDAGMFGMQKMNDMVFASKQMELQSTIDDLVGSIAADQLGDPTKDPLNPENIKSEKFMSEKNEKIKQAIELDFINMPDWLRASTDIPFTRSAGGLKPVTSSTTN